MSYTLFVDESGDQDLEKFRTAERKHGSDPHLVFGGALVPNIFLEDFRKQLLELKDEMDASWLHCTDLSHLKRCYFARTAREMRVLYFGVLSKKETVGSYGALIDGEKKRQQYYNKCAVYLLERVGHFMSQHNFGSDQLSIVFEEKKHDYQAMRNFVRTIRDKPMDVRAKYLQRIDPLSITATAKKDDILLSLADLAAFSIYQSVNITKTNFGIPEQRYLRELKSSFWCDPNTKQIANFGIKFIKGPIQMNLTPENKRFIMKFYRKVKSN